MLTEKKDLLPEDVGGSNQLHRYFNVFMMLIIIMISSSTTVLYLNQEIVSQIVAVSWVAEISLSCTISFTILLICFLVEDSSTFVFLAVFNCIGYAVLNAFAGATMVGIFSKDVIFEFSSEIWYKSETSKSINGATLVLINMVVQVVFASYLAPIFRSYVKNMHSDVFRFSKASILDDGHHMPRTSGKFYDHFAEQQRRKTLPLTRTFSV